MSFAQQLNKALKEKNMTAKKLSEISGVSQPMISEYKRGMEPSDSARIRISQALGFETAPVVRNGKYSTDEAARLLGMSKVSLEIALKENLFDPQIGIAVKHPGGRFTYEIFKKRLDRYIEGG